MNHKNPENSQHRYSTGNTEAEGAHQHPQVLATTVASYQRIMESRPAELTRQPLAKRYVNLSTHNAPIRQTFIISTENNLRCVLHSSHALLALPLYDKYFAFLQLPHVWSIILKTPFVCCGTPLPAREFFLSPFCFSSDQHPDAGRYFSPERSGFQGDHYPNLLISPE